MGNIVSGYVSKVKRYTNGEIDIGFFSDDEEIELHYFINSTKGGSLTREIANALADTLGHNIWAEIQFNDENIATSVELQEFDIDESEEL